MVPELNNGKFYIEGFDLYKVYTKLYVYHTVLLKENELSCEDNNVDQN